MLLNIGDKAPDFKLFSSDKLEVTLADFKGQNLVVLFFPLAFTSVCTTELCNLSDDIASYSNLGAEVVAISTDSVFTLEKYKADQNLPFPLLSDYNKVASEAYGSIYTEFIFGMKGVPKRSAFVVDKEGIIKYAEVLEDAHQIPDFIKVKAALS